MEVVADNINYRREELNNLRTITLKNLRKGKRGRPYKPITHFTREQLNEMVIKKLNELNEN
jgi:hypothetical protein